MKENIGRNGWFTIALGGWLFASVGFVTLALSGSRIGRARLGMGWGLILLWIVSCGLLMWRFRDPIRQKVRAIRLDWRIKFILFATLLAMLEEAITTAMTNLAPLFGVRIGQAYITASTNYLDVIFLHSVVVFVPMFVGWAVILWRYDFSAYAVFLLFGITGTFAEATFGPQHLMEFGMWIFVYGLMVYLPAYCAPSNRKALKPRWWHYPLAVFVPFLFEPLVPLLFIMHLFFPHHPNVHFPPIKM